MKLSIDEKSAVPIFQQIIDGFERLILTGGLTEGSFLPSVREFAIGHSINPNTVSKAYQTLQTKSLVEAVRGLGLKVKKINSKAADQRCKVILEEKVSEIVALAKSLNISTEGLTELILQKTEGAKK
jgi:GntR family transcriptional regulator